MKIQPVRGTHDLFDDMLLKYRKIEEEIRNYANIYGFNEIITPIFESTELFKKPLGEHSDVVLKEMYSFKDRNGAILTLRPEHTTPILRAGISNSLFEKTPQKIFASGPVFRRERPQKGRYRQFNQINFEIIGTYDVMADAELIILAENILKSLLPNVQIDLNINSLGDKNTLNIFKNELSLYYDKYKNSLSIESQEKTKLNPLRILDSKHKNDIDVNQKAPKISDYYSKQAKIDFSNIQNLLSETSIKYNVNTNLVRGLDYYCHTVFEFKTSQLGSQDTIIGGGRYDGLLKVLGGPDFPGVGWAGGVERIILLMQNQIKKEKKVYIILMSENFKNYGLKIAHKLRKNKINVVFDYKYNLKKSLTIANRINSSHALIIGETEVKENSLTIKNLLENTQEKNTIEKVIQDLI